MDQQQDRASNASEPEGQQRRVKVARDIEFLETVCERMQQLGLVESKADFSVKMLGKGPSYLTSMSARERNVPDEVMLELSARMTVDIEDDEAAVFLLSEQCEQRQRVQLHRKEMLGWIEAHRRAIALPTPPEADRLPGGASLWKRLLSRLPFLSEPLPE